jgi:hypothetical protein
MIFFIFFSGFSISEISDFNSQLTAFTTLSLLSRTFTTLSLLSHYSLTLSLLSHYSLTTLAYFHHSLVNSHPLAMDQQSFVQVSFDEKRDAEVYKIVDGNPFVKLNGTKAKLSEDGIKCSLDKSVTRDPIMPVNCRRANINNRRNNYFFNFGFSKTNLKGSIKPANGSNSNVQEEVWPNQYFFYCWYMGENKPPYNKLYAQEFSQNAVGYINQNPNLNFADVMKGMKKTSKPGLFRNGLHICCFNNMFAIFNIGKPMINFKVAILTTDEVDNYSFEVPEIRVEDGFKLFEVRKPKQDPKTLQGLVVYRVDNDIEEAIKRHVIQNCLRERNVSQIFHNTDDGRITLLYFFIPFRGGSWKSGDKSQKKKKFYESIKEGPLAVDVRKIINNSKDQEILFHRKTGFCRLFLEKRRDQKPLIVYEPVEVIGFCDDYCEMVHGSCPSAVFFIEENGFITAFHRHLIPRTFEQAPDVCIDFNYNDQKERTFRSFIETFPSRILHNYKLFDIMDKGTSSSFFALNGCSHAFRRKMEERRGYKQDDGQCDILFARKVIPCLFLEVPEKKDPEEISLYLNKLIVGCVFIVGAKENFRKLNVYLQGGSTIYGYDLEGSAVHIFVQSQKKDIEIKTFILPLPRNEHKDKDNHVEELPKNSDFKNNLQEYIAKYRNNTKLDQKIYENEFADLDYHFVTDAYEFATQNRFHEKSLLFFLMAYLSNKEWYKEWIRKKYLNLKEMGSNN